jgi:hypothetical protein
LYFVTDLELMKKLRLFLIVLTFGIVSHAAEKEIVSQALVRVGTEVLTSRQVILSQVIDSYLRNETKVKVVRPDEPKFNEKTTELALDYIVFLESESYAVGEGQESNIKDQVKTVQSSLGALTELEKFNFTAAEIERLFSVKIKSRRFLELKSQSRASQVSDQRAKDYFDLNRNKFTGASFLDIKENIKVYLQKTDNESKLKDWFEVLKKKYKLKYLSQ